MADSYYHYNIQFTDNKFSVEPIYYNKQEKQKCKLFHLIIELKDEKIIYHFHTLNHRQGILNWEDLLNHPYMNETLKKNEMTILCKSELNFNFSNVLDMVKFYYRFYLYNNHFLCSDLNLYASLKTNNFYNNLKNIIEKQ